MRNKLSCDIRPTIVGFRRNGRYSHRPGWFYPDLEAIVHLASMIGFECSFQFRAPLQNACLRACSDCTINSRDSPRVPIHCKFGLWEAYRYIASHPHPRSRSCSGFLWSFFEVLLWRMKNGHKEVVHRGTKLSVDLYFQYRSWQLFLTIDIWHQPVSQVNSNTARIGILINITSHGSLSLWYFDYIHDPGYFLSAWSLATFRWWGNSDSYGTRVDAYV